MHSELYVFMFGHSVVYSVTISKCVGDMFTHYVLGG